MCGFAGFIDTRSLMNDAEKHSILKKMGHAIEHRGPDQSGEWLSEKGEVGFVHQRLSIIDLSPAGQQPMISQCGRYVIVYNGEVYNYKEIRDELCSTLSEQKFTLRGSSDTEVILEAIALWGLSATLKKMHGMFTFALYDAKTGRLSFARDRMGEKPLYMGSFDGKIVFASELKAIQCLFTTKKPELNRSAIGLYLRHGYIPTPYSIYQDIVKLPSASCLSIDRKDRQKFIDQPACFLKAFEAYWSLSDSISNAPSPGVGEAVVNSSTAEQQEDLSKILHSVVAREMHADVPLGAFLSGGVDSSTIVAIMQQLSDAQGKDPVLTFSIGFEQEQFNEAPFASAVAQHLGTQHHEKIVTTSDVQSIIPSLSTIYDEPFADSSQLPTILVSQLARQHVTVSLSGDGGDELFGGYERYQWANSIWQKVSWMPLHARQIIASLLRLLHVLNSSYAPNKIQNIAAKFSRLASMLSAQNRQFFYRTLISAGVNANEFVLGQNGNELHYALNTEKMADADFIHQMMYLDIHSYLPDDILTKVDRASMSVSLESRVPLLDHAVVEQAWKMRSHCLDTTLPAKQALRKVLYQYVPKSLIERPKKGFAVPLSDWLRGDLLSWAEALLDKDRLKQEGIFDAEKVYDVWLSFKQGKAGSEHFLWSILMFQLWHEKWHS